MGLATATGLIAQDDTSSDNATSDDEEVFELSPFEVSTDSNIGYMATSSLAGTRMDSKLKDIASSISVVTREFMDDTGSTDLQDILVYQTSTEVAGIEGNYYGGRADDYGYRDWVLVNPHQATRVRGLEGADLTRSYFATSVPMDGYNTDRVDIQRGSNSILFGLGSPAGIINTTLREPMLGEKSGAFDITFGSYGTHREVLDLNVPVLKDVLGIRVIGLNEDEKFRQDFTYEQDERVYATGRWRPNLGKHVFTQIDAKVEIARIDSNRPVSVTPMDFISNWFGPLNQYLMYDPLGYNGTPQDENGIGHPELSHYFAGAPARDWWGGGPSTIFQDPNSSATGNGTIDAYSQRDGDPWGGLSGVTNANWDEGGSGIWNKNTSAYFANNPIISKLISDYESSTGNQFNGFSSSLWPAQAILGGPLAFVDQTLQGPNKNEWNDFDVYELSATQTYFDGLFGINAAVYKEDYEYGSHNLVNTNRLSVDVNANLRDGSPNPDVGRPFIWGSSNGTVWEEERESYRITAFAKVNPIDYMEENWITKLVGEQILTGVMSNQKHESFDRSYDLYAWGPEDFGIPYMWEAWNYSWYNINYIGDDLRGINGFDNIPDSAIHPITALHEPGDSNHTLLFDWSDSWSWRPVDVGLLNYRDDLDQLYTWASGWRTETESTSFIWQGKFLNDAIVPLFGWRQDKYEKWNKPSDVVYNDYWQVDPFSPDWKYSSTVTADEQRRSWGVVVHTERILELFDMNLPKGITLSLNYNDSNTFRPSDVGTDVYGNQFPSPRGSTKDYGFLLTALEDRVSLRLTWYETTQQFTNLNAYGGMIWWGKAGVTRTMSAMGMETWGSADSTQPTPEWLVNEWFFGDNYDSAIANQPIPENWRDQMATLANQPLRIRSRAVPGDASYVAEGDINPDSGQPYLAPPLTAEEMEYRTAWFAARSDAEWFRPLDPVWVDAMQFTKSEGDPWRIWTEDPPGGQILVNDLVSEGFELELTMNLLKNWRVTLNVAEASAVRSNIIEDWVAFVEGSKDLWLDGYNNNPGGPSQLNYWTIDGFADIRHWGGDTSYSPLMDTFGGRMMQDVYGPFLNARAGNGQRVSELRQWRFNFVTTYDFIDGPLEGVSIGGAVRWQDKAAIGNYPRYNEVAEQWVVDASSPIYGDTETDIDFWIGYERQLTNRVAWSIQLNVWNLFGDDDLIPIVANPDGTTAQVRIPSETTWQISNTFKF